MNRGVRVASLAGGALASLAAVAIVGGQAASGWDLSWNAITGGGGNSAGGGYEVNGAVLAVDGRAQGGSYVLEGGFFAGEEIEFESVLPAIARDGVN